MNKAYQYVIKAIMIGDTGVGKSCSLLRFTEGRYNEIHDLTIGVEFGTAIMTEPVTNKKVKLQVWDTAGQEMFKSIVRSYYRGTALIILMYDVTRRNTFLNLPGWIDEVRMNGDRTHPPVIILVANKCDSEHKVSVKEGREMAMKHGLHFIESSAKNSKNVKEIFITGVREVMKRYNSVDSASYTGVRQHIQNIDTTPEFNQRPCCRV